LLTLNTVQMLDQSMEIFTISTGIIDFRTFEKTVQTLAQMYRLVGLTEWRSQFEKEKARYRVSTRRLPQNKNHFGSRLSAFFINQVEKVWVM